MDQSLSLPWLLVATPQLTDGNFSRTVVLIVEHSDTGSMGFVINRPIETPLSDLVSVSDVTIPDNIPAWYGGPIDKGTGIILHDRTAMAERLPNKPVSLALSSNETALIDLVTYSQQRFKEVSALESNTPGEIVGSNDGLYPYRFLIGYAGWGAGQLTNELHQGAWIQVKATWDLLFNTSWKLMWDKALGLVGASPRNLAPAVHQYLN